MFICVFNDSALRFPLRVCIDKAEGAIGCIGLHLSGYYLYYHQACIDFKCIGIATGRISLPFCYCIWLPSPSIFAYLLIAHILRLSLSIRVKFIGTLLIQALVACIFCSISVVLRQALGAWVYNCRTILILPLRLFNETATGRHGFIFLGTVLI